MSTANHPIYLPGTVVLPNMAHHPKLRKENITLAGSNPSVIYLIAGLVLLVVAIGASFSQKLAVAHALSSIHIGVMTCLAISLGALFFVQINLLVNAGWYATIRRQMENIASLAPIFGLLAILTPLLDFTVFHGQLFTWMNPEFAHDAILAKKIAFFSPAFFFGRGFFYIAVWTILTRTYLKNSLEEDRTGDRMLCARSRRLATVGLILTALTTAFCAFDWLMSFDFRFFSTMWGVYYFAGAAYSGIAMFILICVALRRRGLLNGLVTEEHFHDLGKFLFAFTIFWAYISFSQYFLIWYSNIPEETAWYVYRKHEGWQYLFFTLCFGHFLVPFLILLFRDVKRNFHALTLMAVWAIFMEVLDMTFIVKPMIFIRESEAGIAHSSTALITAAASLGMLALFMGLLWRKIGQSPLVAVNDPHMAESLGHKNYV